MKILHTYCPICGRTTLHQLYTTNTYGETGFDRVFSGIVTLGMSEIGFKTILKCTQCNKETKLQNDNTKYSF